MLKKYARKQVSTALDSQFHSAQNKSFCKRSSQPVFGFSAEETTEKKTTQKIQKTDMSQMYKHLN